MKEPETGTKIGCRSNFEQETGEVDDQEGQECDHGHKGGDRVHVGQEEAELAQNIGKQHGQRWLICPGSALAKDRKHWQQIIPGNGLKNFGRTDHRSKGCEH